jgi:Family of unknown function (DUF5681)
MEIKAEGRRKDGRPFKEGNTREDGSYDVGKNRAPESTRFAAGDGRKRGKREKGVTNYDTDWDKELNKTVTIKVNGEPKHMSAYRAQVKVTMDAGAKGNIKAQQIIYDRAGRIAAAKAERSVYTDDGIVEAWFAQRQAQQHIGVVGDDANRSDLSAEAGPDDAGGPSNDHE